MKKKKSSFVWRATKGTAKGLGIASWWIMKNTAKGVYYGGKALTGVVRKKHQEHTLKKKPSYQKEAEHTPLEVAVTVSGDFTAAEKRLHNESLIVLIFGKRGSGKSALGFRLLENIHYTTKRPCAVLGVSQESLPQWIQSVEKIEEVKNGGAILIDEGALAFSARESMSKGNKGLGKLLAVARHKDLILFFITQNTGMIDKHVLSLVDTLMIKQGSLLQQEMERPEIKKFYDKADTAFSKVDGDKKSYVYILDSDFEGLVKASLPSFWSEKVSKSRA